MHHINEALHRMAAEGSVVAIYVNEVIFDHDNEVDADGNNSCVKSKQKTSPTKRQKLGYPIKKEMTSGEKYCLFHGHFWCTSYGLKRERETTLSLSCAGGTQQRQMYSRYRLIPHVEVELTPLFNDDDLWYVISKQLGGNGRKFKQGNGACRLQ